MKIYIHTLLIIIINLNLLSILSFFSFIVPPDFLHGYDYRPAFAAQNENRALDVAIVRNSPEVKISGVNYKKSKEYAKIFDKLKLAKNFTNTIRSCGGKIYIASKNSGVSKIKIYSEKNSHLKIDDKAFRGYFTIEAAGDKLNVINTVEIEDYLRAVVPSEMERSAGIEALKAQAIVARTYAIATRGKHKNAGYDLCNTTCCQVYKGVREESAITDKAVAGTRGLVIFCEGRPINAYYCASCGGYTESAEEAWPGSRPLKYSRVIQCPYCKKDGKVTWSYKISLKEFVSKMRNAGFMINDVKSAELYDRTLSGRYNTVKMKGSFGTLYYSAEIFRKIFGNNNIKSSFFNVVIERPKTITKNFKFNRIDDIIKARGNYSHNSQNLNIIFSGSGYGHGVGMCQHGAKKMAGEGKNFRRIINYYFTKEVNIKKIY